jgi:hypothetical protein
MKDNLLHFAHLAIRLFVYAWLSSWVILRSDYLLSLIYDYLYVYIIIVILFSSIMAYRKQDIRMFRKLYNSFNINIFFLILIGIWVQMGIEWVSSIKSNNYESFMFYEPIAIIMAAPGSILIFILKNLFSISNLKAYATVLWALYFITSLSQIGFLVYILRKRNAKSTKGNITI